MACLDKDWHEFDFDDREEADAFVAALTKASSPKTIEHRTLDCGFGYCDVEARLSLTQLALADDIYTEMGY